MMDINMTKTLAKYSKNLITGMVKGKIEDTTNKAILSIRGDILKGVNDSIEEVAEMPHSLYHEVRRNLRTETPTGAFNKSPNNSTYDYFNDYYNHYNKRYNPTPVPNLAEQMYRHEVNLKKHRLYR